MDCKHIKDQLWLYQVGEIDPATAFSVEQHLVDCQACAKELESISELIGNMPERPRLPDSYWEAYSDKVMSQVDVQPQEEPMMSWRWAPAFALGLTLISGVVFYKVKEMNEVRKTEEIISQLEILDNLNVLEREDFDQLEQEAGENI